MEHFVDFIQSLTKEQQGQVFKILDRVCQDIAQASSEPPPGLLETLSLELERYGPNQEAGR